MNHEIETITTFIKKGLMAPVLVIGDLMLDEYHWCQVNRISPEAPVPVCRVESTTLSPGGAGNVANNLRHLDVPVSLLGCVGKDSSGEKLLNCIDEKKINYDGVIQINKPTILKSRVVAHNQQVVRLDREGDGPVSVKDRNLLFKQYQEKLVHCSAVVISDYMKQTLTESFLRKLIDAAKKNNKLIVVDPKGHSFLKYKGASIITPNFKEFQSVVGENVDSENKIFEYGKRIIKKCSLDAIVLTRSEKGMSVITESKKIDIKTEAKQVYDITGAGDTVVALLTIGLAYGYNLEKAARMATIAAGVVIGKPGTATVSWNDLVRFIDNNHE